MKLSEISGQPRAVELLRQALARDRVHHAWLFTGPAGVGKETAARAFAARLLCRKPGEDACGSCASCRKLVRGVQPDLLVILPEAAAVARGLLAREDLSGAASRELKVEQVRRLESALSVAPLSGPTRVTLILEADGMNQAAQNALLKTLEEPPAGNVLILVAEAGDRLLPTIRSRCVRVPFAPLPLALVAERVRASSGVDAATASLVAALSGGSLGVALTLDPAALAGRRRLLEAVEALAPADLRPALRLAEELATKGRDEALAALALLQLFYRDVAATAEGAPEEALCHPDLAALAGTAAARGTPDALRRGALVFAAQGAIGRQGAPRLALERLLLSLVVPADASPRGAA